MRRCRLKITLTDDNILIDIGLFILRLVSSSLIFLVLGGGRILYSFNHFVLKSQVI